MATVVLVGTLDTKGAEYALPARPAARARASTSLLVDAGRLASRSSTPTSRARRSRAPPAPTSRALVGAGDRGAAVDAMAAARPSARAAPARRGPPRRRARRRRLGQLRRSRRGAMRALPVGVPKLMVSTVASGDTRPLRRRHRRHDDVLGRRHRRPQPDLGADPRQRGRPRSPGWRQARRPGERRRPAAGRRDDVRRHDAVRRPRARERLEEPATRCSSSTPPAPAGRRWRRWSRDGFLAGVLDVTTTELADELVGGVLSAGPDRLEAAGRRGHAAGRLARRARHGQLRPARHGPAAVRGPATSTCTTRSVTLMRTTAEEMRRARAADRARSWPRRPVRPCCSSRCGASR